MIAIISRLIDAQKAFLPGDLEIEGKFDKMINFLELLDEGYERLGIL